MIKNLNSATILATVFGALHDVLDEVALGLSEKEPGSVTRSVDEAFDSYAARANTLSDKPEPAWPDTDRTINAQRSTVAPPYGEARMEELKKEVAHWRDCYNQAVAENEREEVWAHFHMRAQIIGLVTTTAPTETPDRILAAAEQFYQFVCYGADKPEDQPNLGMATTAELSAEIAARFEFGHIDPNYRTVDDPKMNGAWVLSTKTTNDEKAGL